EAERQQRQQMLDRRARHEAETGRRPPGPPPAQRDMSGDPPGRVNTTDPDSRLVKTRRGFIQGYNVHAVSTEQQIVVAADVISRSGDQGMLAPMITTAGRQLADAGVGPIEVVLADAGYWAGADIRRLRDD